MEMIFVAIGLGIGLLLGWAIRGLCSRTKVCRCKKCAFTSTTLFPKCPWCGSNVEVNVESK